MCMNVDHLQSFCSWRLEEGIRPPRTEDGCERPGGWRGSNLGPLQEQLMLWTPEPFL